MQYGFVKNHSLAIAFCFMLMPVIVASDGSRAEAAYYDGKTIKILCGWRPGGTANLRARITVKHLRKYMGGDPVFVFQFMPGAGGIGATNHLAKSVRRDGFTIASATSGIFSSAFLGAPSVRYNLDDFVILGAGSPGGVTTLIIRPELKIDSIEKLRAYEGLRFANRAVGHSLYNRDRITAYMLGLKNPKWILGYNTSEIRLALERGEADASFGGIAGLLRRSPHWIKEGFTFPVVMKDVKGHGVEVFPSFPQGVPSLDQFADTKLKRAVLRLHYASTPGGTFFFVHKGVPSKALNTLKSAFDKVWKDPGFAKEYEKVTRQKAEPMTGKDYMDLLGSRPKDPKVTELYQQIAGPGPLPQDR